MLEDPTACTIVSLFSKHPMTRYTTLISHLLILPLVTIRAKLFTNPNIYILSPLPSDNQKVNLMETEYITLD